MSQSMASDPDPSTSSSLLSDILMHPDILLSIVRQITNLSDYFRFAGVCKSWRSAALLDRFATARHQIPGLISINRSGVHFRFLPIVPGGGDRSAAQNREGRPYPNHRLKLIEHIQSNFDLSPFHGWTFFKNNDTAIVNPSIGVNIPLPHIDNNRDRSSIAKAAITSIPSAPATATDTTKACYILVLLRVDDVPMISFIKVGDADWRHIEPGPGTVFEDAMYLNGKFYLLTNNGNLYAIDEDQFDFASPVVHNVARLDLPSFCEELDEENEEPASVNEESGLEDEDEDEYEDDNEDLGSEEDYNNEELAPEEEEEEEIEFSSRLVEIGGELMVLVHYFKRKKMFEIYKLDLSTNDWFRVEDSFGDYALFVGDDQQAFALPMASVPASYKCIMANNIYFTTSEVEKQFAYNFGDSARRELCCPRHLSNTVEHVGFWFSPVPW